MQRVRRSAAEKMVSPRGLTWNPEYEWLRKIPKNLQNVVSPTGLESLQTSIDSWFPADGQCRAAGISRPPDAELSLALGMIVST